MARTVLILLAIILAAPRLPAQTLSSIDRQRGHVMLRFTERDLREFYYDATFRGVDLAQRFREADAGIERARTLGEMFRAIASPLTALGDAHTVFVPPRRTLQVRYGWEMAMIGDSCFVTGVDAGSDAAAQGVAPGDLVLAVDGVRPTRATIAALNYMLKALDPRPSLDVRVRTGSGRFRDLHLASKMLERERIIDLSGTTDIFDFWSSEWEIRGAGAARASRLKLIGDDVTVWRLPRFDLTAAEIGRLMGKVMPSRTLVLDLRNNPGGRIETLASLAGYFFDRDITLFSATGRTGKDSVVARRQADCYHGMLIVLVDSRSRSSSEIFARTVQVQNRGILLGDVSGGSVMEGVYRPRSVGGQNIVCYGANISVAEITLPDGGRLEGTGVRPDEIILPGSRDLAEGRDPVMARATALAGAPLDASRSGMLFATKFP